MFLSPDNSFIYMNIQEGKLARSACKYFCPPYYLYKFSEFPAFIFQGFPSLYFKNHPPFLPKTLDKSPKICGEAD